VNLALFKIRMFTFSILSLLLIATTVSAMSFLMPFYIQDVLHFSASFMGLIFLAAPVLTIGLATVSGRLTDRIGPRIPASIGVLATMGAFAIGLVLRVDSHWILPTLMMARAWRSWPSPSSRRSCAEAPGSRRRSRLPERPTGSAGARCPGSSRAPAAAPRHRFAAR